MSARRIYHFNDEAERETTLSVARLLGQAIRSIHEETSVSSLFV